ncbi:MAG TPA: putative N-acetylmannosamine-6-phosphate 2-epimerase [Terracidiphilus sp.]|jgi:predicted NBD/HSP70 family sugar kinase/putative N-acetylmannosamine-6-phosphate epimerase|nr:putative N-acetylmannosamine-6-phosphate 2-epimerase [Terracidiphilus sp.]
MQTTKERLKGALVVSCQASPGNPMDNTEAIRRMALAALENGAGGLRVNSPEHIAAIRLHTDIPIIGIQKRYRNGDLFITPDFESAAGLATAGASIIALDCTRRANGHTWSHETSWQLLIQRIHRELNLPVMADVATLDEAQAAAAAGADFVGTTLNGYTEETRGIRSFDWSLLAAMADQLLVPVVAEGHICWPEQAQRAISTGAWCVVVGSAITRPGSITARFVRAMHREQEKSPAIGVDIGGTAIKAAMVGRDGEVRFPVRVPTDAGKGRTAISASLLQAITQVLATARENNIVPAGLGIASAGSIEASTGSIFAATDNLPGWTGFNLRGFAEEHFQLPTYVVNDAHAAVLAELHFGAGRTLSDFVAITVGTGIGGGIVCNRRLLTGQHGFAGTIGHQTIRVGGELCNCGRRGCLEAYVSTCALLREYKTLNGMLDSTLDSAAQALEISRLAGEGDPAAGGAYSVLAEYLAEGVANIFNILDPEAVLISGGLIAGQADFIAQVERRIREILHFGEKRRPLVMAAQAGQFAGVQGAAAMAFAPSYEQGDC